MRVWSKHDWESRENFACVMQRHGMGSFQKSLNREMVKGREPRAKEIYAALGCVSSLGEETDHFNEKAYVGIFREVAQLHMKQPIQRCAACKKYLGRPPQQVLPKGANEDNAEYTITSRCASCNRCVCSSDDACPSVEAFGTDMRMYCSKACKVRAPSPLPPISTQLHSPRTT